MSVASPSSAPESAPEGRSSFFGRVVALRLYAATGSEWVRSRVRRLVLQREGGPAHSLGIREILRRFYDVQVGLYTAGPCLMKPMVFHRGTVIGRYSCIADSVRTFTRNHPMDLKSTHGFFYNASLGRVKTGPLRFGDLTIGNGVCIGHNAILLPPTRSIGDGAMITPGTVVCSNVPPYAIVSGFPARVTGYRYAKEVIEKLMASRWWDRRLADLEASPPAREPQVAGDGEVRRTTTSVDQNSAVAPAIVAGCCSSALP